MKRMRNNFYIETIIELVKRQEPNRSDIVEMLENCPMKKWKKRAYIHFVDSKNANQLNSEWQFKESVVFEDEKHGTIVVDILKDNRIGAIEFLSLIP
jgi:hypothetical protein